MRKISIFKETDSQQHRDRATGSTTERPMPRYKEAKTERGRQISYDMGIDKKIEKETVRYGQRDIDRESEILSSTER